VNQDSFDILKTLGKGYFGKVFLAQKKSNKKLYAIKVISKVDVIKKKFFKSL
jgi:serine/threonine protein kinase